MVGMEAEAYRCLRRGRIEASTEQLKGEQVLLAAFYTIVVYYPSRKSVAPNTENVSCNLFLCEAIICRVVRAQAWTEGRQHGWSYVFEGSEKT